MPCVALQPLRWLRPLGRLLPPRAASGRVLLVKFWGIGSLQTMTPAVRVVAVVLVLLPGGMFLRGAQPDVDRPGYDEEATDFEGPAAEVTVPAFFFAKYETTAAQWARLTGDPIAR